MYLSKLNILINDTFVSACVLNIERTENANPVLKYNGADDEFQPIMASELTFNMLVPDAADGKFLHLFTGNETRYQVQLENRLTGAILWTGFLLPDFYSEPYENGCFFVSFTATDGLARLKNKYLSDDFYKDQKTLPQVITACLKLTGNVFNTAIAPAITSAVVTLMQYEILVPTDLYIKKEKKQNAYQILEDLLTVMGCRLFLWNDVWYIIGINRYNDLTVNTEFYGTDGAYLGPNTITRTTNSVLFEAHPSISAMPPFKDVVIDWQKDQRDNVFPADVVFQKDASPYTVKYWLQTGSLFTVRLNYDNALAPKVVKPDYGLYYLNLMGSVVSANINDQYVKLQSSVGVDGNMAFTKTIDIDFEATIWCSGDPSAKVLSNSYRKKLLYDLTKNDVTLISNKVEFEEAYKYDFTFEVGEPEMLNQLFYPIKCKLKVEGILIDDYGDLNIKLHPVITVVDAPNAVRVAYTKLDVIYKTVDENSILTKSRNIDFTSVKELTTNWGFEKSDLTANKLLISPLVAIPSVDVNTPATQYAINAANFDEEIYVDPYDSWFNYTVYTWGISQKDYYLLKKYPEKLYLKNAGTNLLTLLVGYTVWETTTNITGYILRLYVYDGSSLIITAADDLLLDIPAETITITDDRYLLDAWKRVGETESVNYNEALARVYHSTVGEVKFKLEGNVFELVNPVEFFQFNYFESRNYNATSLTMNLSEGITTCVFIESVKAVIEDYETTAVLINEDIEA